MSKAQRERLADRMTEHAEWYLEYALNGCDHASEAEVRDEYEMLIEAADLIRKGAVS